MATSSAFVPWWWLRLFWIGIIQTTIDVTLKISLAVAGACWWCYGAVWGHCILIIWVYWLRIQSRGSLGMVQISWAGLGVLWKCNKNLSHHSWGNQTGTQMCTVLPHQCGHQEKLSSYGWFVLPTLIPETDPSPSSIIPHVSALLDLVHYSLCLRLFGSSFMALTMSKPHLSLKDIWIGSNSSY